MDSVFYKGAGPGMHCAVGLDSDAGNSRASIDGALDRAAERGEIVELYGHRPGVTMQRSMLLHVLEGATARGLRFVTYAELARGEASGPALALSIDDDALGLWTEIRPLLAQHGAKVTFFVTRYAALDADEKAQLAALAADGHDLEAHSVHHLRAPEYVEANGLAAYLANEALPSIEIMRADGYEISAYAYPFGARTDELDRALLRYVPLVRSVAFSYGGVINDPCPR